ncbi:MAG: ester cyclase [Pseudomonadota bacterium]
MTAQALLASVAAAAVLMAAPSASADDKATVAVFYDLLSNPGSAELVDAFQDVTSDTWESIGTYSGETKSREAFLGQMGGFAQLLPDLEWAVQAMHQDDNVITVRSRATGTPVAPFLGVDGEGRSFDIMTIDIHELENGKIVRTYHVEDWATGLQQLSGK